MIWRMTLTFFFIETLARVMMNSSNISSKWNNPDSEFYSILVTEFLYMFTEVALGKYAYLSHTKCDQMS